MQVTINRQLLGIEDLLFGVGTVEQIRGGQLLTVTKINAANLPFDNTRTLAEAMLVIDTEIIPNLATILASPANAQIAANAASAAQNLYNLAASLYDQFDDRYLGSKDIDPILDNDGNMLLLGALYFNTITNRMRVWNGTTWGDSLVLTTTSISTLTNKTIDDISNKVGANHIHYPVRNVSGSTIAAGTVVTAQGTQSGTDYIEVVPVTNAQTQIALGIMHNTVANNGTGICMNTGVCADMVNTSGWAVGTILYPNNTGGLTSTKPTSGQYQACAIVLRSHSNQGTMLIEFTEPKYIASTTQAGYVQLNNTLTSTSTTQALTAAQGKALNDRLTAAEDDTNKISTTAITSVTFNSDGTITIVTP